MSIPAVAAVLHDGSEEFVLESVEIDHPTDDEVLVRIEAAGICHTDLMARHMLKRPSVLGHECAGTVVARGDRVVDVAIGAPVTVSYPSCGGCDACTSSRPHLCDHHMPLGFGGGRLDGSQPIRLRGQPISSAFFQQSSFAAYAVTPARSVVCGHGDIAPEIRAAAACGVQTGAGAVMNTFKMGPGESLAVLGAGTVGLAAVMAASLCGARPIIAVDREPSRLELAASLGATHGVLAQSGEVTEQLRAISRGGLDYTLETTTADTMLEVGIAALRPGGECGMVSAPHFGEKYPFSPTEIFKRAVSVRGIIQGSALPRLFLPRLFELYRAGRFPLDALVRTYPFDEINQAVRDIGAGRTVKAILALPTAGA